MGPSGHGVHAHPVVAHFGDEFDGAVAPASFEQDVMYIDAMDDDVGMLETGPERGPGGDPDQLLAAEGVHQQQC